MSIAASVKKAEGFIGTATVLLLDPRHIEFDPHNPRKKVGNTPDDTVLKEHIRHGGHVPPLLVRKGENGFVVVGGNRRLYAYKALISEGVEFASVKCELVKEEDPSKLLVMALTDNEGKPLTTMEIADTYAVLHEQGMRAKDIATAVNKTNAHVSQMLRIAKATPPQKKRVLSGEITPSELYKILVAEDKAHGEEPTPVAPKDEKNEEGHTSEQPMVTEDGATTNPEEPVSDAVTTAIDNVVKAKETRKAATKAVTKAAKEVEDETNVKLDADDKQIVKLLERYSADGLLAKASRAATVCAKLYPNQKKKWLKMSELLDECTEFFSK
jgi:ParB/RepB/Spo0J family partition protein